MTVINGKGSRGSSKEQGPQHNRGISFDVEGPKVNPDRVPEGEMGKSCGLRQVVGSFANLRAGGGMELTITKNM